MKQVSLLSGQQKAVACGHPWIYRNQIDMRGWQELDDSIPLPGDLVTVQDSRGRYIGSGFYNPSSMIAVRLLTHRREPVDDAMISTRIRAAVLYRRQQMRQDTDSCRLVFAEADRLPGVIADLFGDTIILQILALGMDRWQDLIIATLIDEAKPKRLILKNDDPIREKEGLPLYRKVCLGDDAEQVFIRENGLRLTVDLAHGQKTGYFLDQKANHAHLRAYAPGKSVLDCFCYSGGFALNAVAAGASSVTAVDLSEDAVGLARANAALNGMSDKIRFVTANAFDYLRQSVSEQVSYDIIVLDPPAFAKSHAARTPARRGYKEINLSALRLLGPGGILATHSCSYHMPEDLFLETVLEAARDAHRIVRILEMRRQDYDHPVLAGYPESHYLKSLWLQVIE
jgi:23S rRNA (cytosine1962-C5)-methyltransferase